MYVLPSFYGMFLGGFNPCVYTVHKTSLYCAYCKVYSLAIRRRWLPVVRRLLAASWFISSAVGGVKM
jgi:hypothetical protein